MYKITVDDEILYDLRIEDKKIVNPVLNLELNTSGSLTFSIPPTNNKNKKLFPVAVSLCTNAVIRTGIEIHLRINLLLLVS